MDEDTVEGGDTTAVGYDPLAFSSSSPDFDVTNPFGLDNPDAYKFIPLVDWGSQTDWSKINTLAADKDNPLLKGLTNTPLGNYFDTSNIFSPANANYDPEYKVGGKSLKYLWNEYGKPIKDLWDKYAEPVLNSRLGMAGLGALANYLDRQEPSGGGYAKRYTGYTPIQRTIVQGKYGPIAQYSAAPGGITNTGGSTSGGSGSTNTGGSTSGGSGSTNTGGSTSGGSTSGGTGATNTNTTGVTDPNTYNNDVVPGGIRTVVTNPNSFNNDVVEVQERARGGILGFPRYAYGGPVVLEDGGFVLTKKAVDGAGGERGLDSLVPSAEMIRGRGTGTSDDIKGMIVNNRTGRTTPAAVSNGEAYVPKRTVDQMGGARQLYALMNKLERRG